METEAEDAENNDHLVNWSGSDGSQELCISETMAELYADDSVSDVEYPSDPTDVSKVDPECLQSQDWEPISEQQSLTELSGSEEDVSYKETNIIYLGESREPAHIDTSPTSVSSQATSPDPETGQISETQPVPSSASLCCGDMTLALTPDSNSQGPGACVAAAESRRVESPEEGGCTEAPPAPVSFGISGEGAEQAEKLESEFDRDLCRPDRHGARYTRFSHIESQSEKNAKETKSKCNRIARLLTDAPNPQNKGALLFKRRRQRVKKFTLVSYGTGENELDDKDRIEEEAAEVGSVGFNFVPTSDSELDEEYFVYHQQQNLYLNWENLQEMEGLPETHGKGVTMFAQRRQRMDEIALEHEELRSKGFPVEGMTAAQHTEMHNTYDTEETYMHTDRANQNCMDASLKQNSQYEENVQQMNHLPNIPRPLVPNRTAKPFLGFQDAPAHFVPGVTVPVTKKHELKFKVPVPINTSPQVWSPTGDIIASRDERISVPAIKTGTLPESKRRGTNKQSSTPYQASDLHLQKKGERKSYIESEEDFFSLGAEACNFMQPRTVKLKNPPPVAPKPTIDPTCAPWLKKSTSLEPFNPPRSPVSPSGLSPAGPHTQHYLQQQDLAQPQQMGRWAPVQTQAPLQTPATAWAPANPSPQPQLQPPMKSWSRQPPQLPVSIQALSPTYCPPHPPSSSRNKSPNAANSVASCPPQPVNSYIHASKAGPASPRGQATDKGISRAGDGPTMMGKGAQLFAKRQSRMEKFVVDAETVQANKARSQSPTSSLPNYWRYSSNVRAPPPVSYNPLLAPFYPPSAAKQPPSTSPKIKAKTKEKPKAPPKHLNTLDVMKHQPYQLDSSLFKYDAVTEAKTPSPKTSPAPIVEVTPTHKPSSSPSYFPYNVCDLAHQSKSKAPAKSSGLVSSQSPSTRQYTRTTEPRTLDKHLDEKPTPTSVHHIPNKQAPSTQPTSTSQQPSLDSLASAFSPASLIARGARQMAPRPTFSAKKPVGLGRSYSLSLPRRLNSVPSHSPLSPVSTPGFQPSYTQRKSSWQENTHKPPTPWEAAFRSPIGSVDEAFTFQSFQSSIASNVKAAGQRRSLPEPPAEWKCRVSLDPTPVSKGHYHAAPAFQAPSVSRTFSPEKPPFYGPPFRPAQPLWSAGKATIGYMGQGTNPTKYSPLLSTAQRT